RRANSDLRAYDWARAAPRRRLQLLRRSAESEGNGDLSGARLRRARLSERRPQPLGNDCIVGNCVDARVHDGQVKLRIFGAGPFATAPQYDEQAAVDLLAPVHSGSVLLADEAALAKADAVQFDSIAFEPEEVAKFGAA